MAKSKGQFTDEWGKSTAKERYARGGEIPSDHPKPDVVGGPATDSDLSGMDTENYSVGKRVRPHYERKDDF